MSQLISNLKQRGFIDTFTNESQLIEHLQQPRTFYVGFDPTADSLHIGHLLPLKLIQLMTASGHKPIVLLGSATARIGDPTGKSKSRIALSSVETDSNTESIRTQIQKILGGEITFFENSHPGMTWMEFVMDVFSHFSVNEMVKRKTFAERLSNAQHLSLSEFVYPVLQAFDWLVLCRKFDCTLQIAGLDQWTNCCAGKELIRSELETDAHIICTPLLEVNGKKMGKSSTGDVLWLNENKTSPFEVWQFFRNLPDEEIEKFGLLFADDWLPSEDINESKIQLANAVVKWIHGNESVEKCARRGIAISKKTELQIEDLPTLEVDFGKHSAMSLFVHSGLCSSNSDFKRSVKNKGMKINDQLIVDERMVLIIDRTFILSHGKRQIAIGMRKGNLNDQN